MPPSVALVLGAPPGPPADDDALLDELPATAGGAVFVMLAVSVELFDPTVDGAVFARVNPVRGGFVGEYGPPAIFSKSNTAIAAAIPLR